MTITETHPTSAANNETTRPTAVLADGTNVWSWTLTLDLANPAHHHYLKDTHATHRLVMAGYPPNLGPEPRAAHNIQWATAPHPTNPTLRLIHIRATHPGGTWPPEHHPTPNTADQPPAAGSTVTVHLTANATRRQASTGNTYAHPDPAAWLTDRTPQLGATLTDITTHTATTHGQSRHHRTTHHTVNYTATATITNPDLFTAAWVTGIGRAKAYGHGMIRIA